MSPTFERRTPLPVPRGFAFAWHERPGALERLAPPWRRVRVLERSGGLLDGGRMTFDTGFPGGRWSIEHEGYQAGIAFRDRLRSGPFARWEHEHRFEPDGPGACVLVDRVEWRLPFAPLSSPANGAVARHLARVIAYRAHVLRFDLARAAARPARVRRVALFGASGFVGAALEPFLSTQGWDVTRFVRRPARVPGEVAWDARAGSLDPRVLEPFDGVVQLSGASIGDSAWTPERRERLVQSRVRTTDLVARALAALGPGRTFVCASACGWYGDRGDEWLEETSGPGRGFLAELARRWEAAASPAAGAGARVVHARFGIVLGPGGGVLARLLPLARAGLAGPLGDGRAWWSWISLHDVLDVIARALEDERLEGAVNAVAPGPRRQAELARALGRVLGRPSGLIAPAFALRWALGGERARELVLASQRVRPAVLEKLGHVFRDPDLEPALARMLGRVDDSA